MSKTTETKAAETKPQITVSEAKEKIKTLQQDLEYQMNHPPQTRDNMDWGYYDAYINRLKTNIAELRKIAPLDKTNKEEVLMVTPQEIFSPKTVDNIKGVGILFLQTVPKEEDELAKVNAVGYAQPRVFHTLEGDVSTDVTMGDVKGNVYNNFKQLKKQIIKNKIQADPQNAYSEQFVELIKAGKDDEAKALLIKATEETGNNK